MAKSQEMSDEEESSENWTRHHLSVPAGLSSEDFEGVLKSAVIEFHSYKLKPGQCSSLVAQIVQAPPEDVWAIVRRFDDPRSYKHFIKSCSVRDDFSLKIGDLRELTVISGLPAETSTERLDILDEERRLTGFSIIGGEHRLRNYRSVTSLHVIGKRSTAVLESYLVDVPAGNSEEDTRLFADTVVKLNLQNLAAVAAAPYISTN
ncbi:hypothetical protein M569_10566 [Genlisea aurea]|uniref:Uncharacterized protein n=1 Tax=Genlisea aurea TaxID=192259 RepID=S8DW99_9LAMI|nr:hypothetical protein M569_10566 [Genlisea aurea]